MEPSNIQTIENFKTALQKALPGVTLELDGPFGGKLWWLDLRNDSSHLPMTWSEEGGFGLFPSYYQDPDSVGYGDTKPEESYTSIDATLKRLVEIISELPEPEGRSAFVPDTKLPRRDL